MGAYAGTPNVSTVPGIFFYGQFYLNVIKHDKKKALPLIEMVHFVVLYSMMSQSIPSPVDANDFYGIPVSL